MKHVKPISVAFDSNGGETTLLEQVILLLLGIYFSNWENYSAVIRNLQKYYAKT